MQCRRNVEPKFYIHLLGFSRMLEEKEQIWIPRMCTRWVLYIEHNFSKNRSKLL